MNIKIDISVCRVCLKSGDGKSLYSDQDLGDKFKYVTQAKLIQGDGLPEQLCNNCVRRLKLAFEFRKQSESSAAHLRSFITKVNKQFTQVTTVRDNDNDEEVDMEDYLFEGEFGEQSQDESSDLNTITKLKELDVEITDSVQKIKAENVETETIEEIIFENNEDEIVDSNSNEEIEQMEQMEEVVLDNEVYEEEHLLDEVYLEEQEQAFSSAPSKKRTKKEYMTLHYCKRCNKDFSTKTNLLRHIQTHDGNKPYVCNICGAGFTQNGSLKQHVFIHTGERPYTCSICNRGFTQSKSLVFHMRRHTGEKPFSCNQCGDTFRQRDGLKRHELIKHNPDAVMKFSCEVCKKELLSRYSYRKHVEKHYNGNKKDFKCTECEKKFASKATLKTHLCQFVDGEKGYKCAECDADFATKTQLNDHLKLHQDVKPLSCEKCDLVFVDKQEYCDHIKLHNQPIKKFKCSQCSKAFLIKSNLLQHLKNHERILDSIHQCDDCDMGFDTVRALRLHRTNQHNEVVDNLYDCDVCDTKFINAADLNAHIAAEHDTILEKCSHCNEEFTSQRAFDEHLVEHELGMIVKN